MKFINCLIFLIVSLFAINVFANSPTAPVSGFVRNLGTNEPVADAIITVLENGVRLKTNKKGEFGPVDWPVGTNITLLFEKWGYRSTQTATVSVPPEGLTGPYHNMTFQAINLLTFGLFAKAMGKAVDENKCHVIATVTAYHKTMDDLPQGEPHARVVLIPLAQEIPYYFDIFKKGPMKNYPNPLTRGLIETSEDGGVIYANLEPLETPYTLITTKAGVVFNRVQFACKKGMLVNLSPPQGPMVQAV